jgi:hypothetical protein
MSPSVEGGKTFLFSLSLSLVPENRKLSTSIASIKFF